MREIRRRIDRRDITIPLSGDEVSEIYKAELDRKLKREILHRHPELENSATRLEHVAAIVFDMMMGDLDENIREAVSLYEENEN